MGTRHMQFTFTLAGRLLSGITSVTALLISLAMQTAAAAGSVPHGNQLNTHNQPSMIVPDPAGLNVFQQNTRTPSGFLYPDVWKWPELRPADDGDWQYSLSLAAGVLGVSDAPGPASFREYGDWDDGFILNRFDAFAMNPRTSHYFGIYGGSTGRSDQYVQASAGKYGQYNLMLAFDSIPHVFTTNARVLWEGAGADYLALPAPLAPGGNSVADVLSALQITGASTLALEREKAQVALTFSPSRMLKVAASGSMEWREGSRPFGGGFNYPGFGQVTEIVEPVDYVTNQVDIGLAYTGETYQGSLAYAGSYFSNRNGSLTWENPGLTPIPLLTPSQGRYALAPDNQFHSLRADIAASLPYWDSRVTTSMAYTQSRQNDVLIPPTITTGTVGNAPNAFNYDLWNTVDALSTDRAGAEIKSLMAHSRITMNPTSRLSLAGEFRYDDQDNETRYTAYNPLTGEYGYIAMDGGYGPQIFDPDSAGSRARIRFRSIPFEKDSVFLAANVDYQWSQVTEIGAAIEREAADYTARELDEVIDHRYRLNLTHRVQGSGTLRLSYEYSERSGDDYEPNPYEPYYTSSLPNYIPRFPDGQILHTLSAMRKYDIAERNSHTIDAKYNWIVSEDMDLLIGGKYREIDYDGQYGLNDALSVSANLEWNYQLALNRMVYIFYSFQSEERSQTNIADAGLRSSDDSPGGPVYPLENRWSEEISESNHNLGAGLALSFDSFSVDLNYTYLVSDSEFSYAYASPAAFQNAFPAGEAGNGFPDQKFRHHFLEGNLRWQARDNLILRLLYRFERENLDDFHYQGLTEPLVGDQLYLVTIPENYSTHVIGLIIETSFW